MLNLNSIMIGTTNLDTMAEVYEKIFGKKPDMSEGGYHGWSVGNCFFAVGKHSKMDGKTKDAGRVMFNFETKEVKEEFERIRAIDGITVIAEPYEMGSAWVATLADPDGNYFQLMTPWEDTQKE